MFATTRWSLVAAARDRAAPPAREALAELCRAYWYPVYAFVRRCGHGHAEAEDLTQEFFARLLGKDALAAVDPARGRFRSFLLASCRHFLANQHDRERARKRGGGRPTLPLDFGGADDRYRREPAHDDTPEKLFERRWALALLDEVLARLRAEYEATGKGQLFALLKGHLTGDDPGLPHAAAAEQLGMTEGAVKVAVHRLRKSYRELLRQEIAQTLADPAEVDDEIRSLFAALAP
jgi:RNA polymerase sigma-70 factor (ECF subfamily)